MTHYQIAKSWQSSPSNDKIIEFKRWIVQQLHLDVDLNDTVVVCAELIDHTIGVVCRLDSVTYYCRLTPDDCLIDISDETNEEDVGCFFPGSCQGGTNGDVFGDLYEHLEEEIHAAHRNIFDKKGDAIMSLFARWHNSAKESYPNYQQYCVKCEKK